jgi:hypothetical protein
MYAYNKFVSANGAIHPCGVFWNGVVHSLGRWGELSALVDFMMPYPGRFAPGWYEGAPLALTDNSLEPFPFLWRRIMGRRE